MRRLPWMWPAMNFFVSASEQVQYTIRRSGRFTINRTKTLSITASRPRRRTSKFKATQKCDSFRWISCLRGRWKRKSIGRGQRLFKRNFRVRFEIVRSKTFSSKTLIFRSDFPSKHWSLSAFHLRASQAINLLRAAFQQFHTRATQRENEKKQNCPRDQMEKLFD